jgi:hypothetical protein
MYLGVITGVMTGYLDVITGVTCCTHCFTTDTTGDITGVITGVMTGRSPDVEFMATDEMRPWCCPSPALQCFNYMIPVVFVSRQLV